MTIFRSAALFLCLSLPVPVHADLQTANDMVARGDLAGAAREFQKLAQQGNATAQAQLGYMYYAVGSSRVDLQACKLEYSIVSPK